MSQSWDDAPTEVWERYILAADDERSAPDGPSGLIKGILAGILIEGVALLVIVVLWLGLSGRIAS